MYDSLKLFSTRVSNVRLLSMVNLNFGMGRQQYGLPMEDTIEQLLLRYSTLSTETLDGNETQIAPYGGLAGWQVHKDTGLTV